MTDDKNCPVTCPHPQACTNADTCVHLSKRSKISEVENDLEHEASDNFGSAVNWGDGWGDACAWTVDKCLQAGINIGLEMAAERAAMGYAANEDCDDIARDIRSYKTEVKFKKRK